MSSENPDLSEAAMRVRMFEGFEDALEQHRESARLLHTVIDAHHRLSDPGNIRPFLTGVQAGLRIAEMESEDRINQTLLHGTEDDQEGSQ